jgi:hypothetical protein
MGEGAIRGSGIARDAGLGLGAGTPGLPAPISNANFGGRCNATSGLCRVADRPKAKMERSIASPRHMTDNRPSNNGDSERHLAFCIAFPIPYVHR